MLCSRHLRSFAIAQSGLSGIFLKIQEMDMTKIVFEDYLDDIKTIFGGSICSYITFTKKITTYKATYNL
jgi:hypothetical protein